MRTAVITIIKLSKYIYINPLTIILFAVCWFNRHLEMMCAAYSAMLLHETAHLAAALLIGLKPSYMCFQPFGVNLRLKNRIVYSLSDEIILYLSGPLTNIILSLAALILSVKTGNPLADFFYKENIALFIMNMLPVFPLDGGIILKKIISYKTGSQLAEKITKAISIVIILCITVFLAYGAYTSGFNYSALFLAVFLIANIFTQKEKYNVDVLKEIMFYRQKEYKNKKIRLKVCSADGDMHELVSGFRNDSFYIIILLSSDGSIDEILTETLLIDRILA